MAQRVTWTGQTPLRTEEYTEDICLRLDRQYACWGAATCSCWPDKNPTDSSLPTSEELQVQTWTQTWRVFYSSQESLPHVVHLFLCQSDYNYKITRAWTITIRCSKTSSHMAGGTRIPALNRSSLFSLKKVRCWEKSTGKWQNAEGKRGLDERKGGERRGNFHKMAVWRRPWGISSKTTFTSRFFFGTFFSQTTFLRGGELEMLLSEYCAQEQMNSEMLDNQMGAQSGGWPGWPQTHAQILSWDTTGLCYYFTEIPTIGLREILFFFFLFVGQEDTFMPSHNTEDTLHRSNCILRSDILLTVG